MHISVGLIARVRRLAFAVGVLRRPAPPTLPLLAYAGETGAADWLRESLRTFGRRVASYLPDRFPAYARIHHPFEFGGAAPVAPGTWAELASRYGVDLRDPAAAEPFAHHGVPDARAQRGSLPLPVIDALLDHLGRATATPESCYFAVWPGFGDSIVPADLDTTLELPHRQYHVFTGPLAAARTSYSIIPFSHQSASLWWPADRAWCVATEIDFAWTYVGGSRAVVAALLADSRLDAVETAAASRW